MTIYLNTNKIQFISDMADVIRLFFGEVKFITNENICCNEDISFGIEYNIDYLEKAISLSLKINKDRFDAVEKLNIDRNKEAILYKRHEKRLLKQHLYAALKKRTGKYIPWGALTGIRPTRLVYEAMEQGLDLKKAVEYIGKEFDLGTDKKALLREVISFQLEMLSPAEKGTSIYIGIPFCVSKCSYCTFSSGELGDGKLVAPYIDALLWEIEKTGELFKKLELFPRSIYVGGGTPTALEAKDLEKVLKKTVETFPAVKEFTVEAGRPDTIDREKLELIKAMGGNRISINPQTMKEETLERIGRKHTSKQTLKAFELAKNVGFKSINMDIIAGLPGEKLEDFKQTLKTVIYLKPENITVHSLSLKRGSELWLEREKNEISDLDVSNMTQFAREYCKSHGFRPYYLYRQKYIAGNQENVGYALENSACQYNVDMMEETSHIFALGAGGISKRIYKKENRIERAANVSDIQHYILRREEMLARKEKLWDIS